MRDIPGYEGLYAATSCGRVWNYKKQRFEPDYDNGNGYRIVRLYKDGKYHTTMVHRCVALAYISNPDNLPQVNHKDEIKYHNWLNNLEWCSAAYNKAYSAGKKVMCIETGKIYNLVKDVVQDGFSKESVARCARGERNTYKGLHWKYI